MQKCKRYGHLDRYRGYKLGRASHFYNVGYASSLPYPLFPVDRKLEAYATSTTDQPCPNLPTSPKIYVGLFRKLSNTLRFAVIQEYFQSQTRSHHERTEYPDRYYY